jgi:hypothetical protein
LARANRGEFGDDEIGQVAGGRAEIVGKKRAKGGAGLMGCDQEVPRKDGRGKWSGR